MKKLNKSKGITLVALVVTIIVLLILAGVAISLVINNNGIFIRAQNAKEKQTKSEVTEIINLKISGIQIESYVETEQLHTLQYLADKLCNDDEMEYIIKKQ